MNIGSIFIISCATIIYLLRIMFIKVQIAAIACSIEPMI